MDVKGRTVAFLGDSITEGVGTEEGKRYWELFADRTGAVCFGYGAGGSCIARQQRPELLEWNGNIRRHFITRVGSMTPEADMVVVLGGVNDFGHGDAPLGGMDDRTEDTFYGALHDLYTRLTHRYPNGRVVIMTPLHCAVEQDVEKLPALADYVEAIRRVAAYYGLPLLDLYTASGIRPWETAHRERYMPDGLHPNAAGHERIAALLTDFVVSL